MSNIALRDLLDEVSHCRLCEAHLPLGPRPVLQLAPQAPLLIIGQAPGTRVHASGIPWNDPSGERLRQWLDLDKTRFYDPAQLAIIPMGLCYPGKGKSGDLPPRPECAPHWHQRLLAQLPQRRLTLLIGQYAQNAYLPLAYRQAHTSLTERVRHWQSLDPSLMPLVHPSPRNQRWLRQNPWYEQEVVPALRQRVDDCLNPD